ncbi:MAG TPA: MmgE/PrpD family protein [Burkholderiales bacterium]|nr:MmgE/PrpD family protein [Burkholderiales bacterium]
MATVAQRLSEYACSLQPRDLPPEVVSQAKRLIVDTIGCAIGGYTSEPAKIARDLAAACGSGRSRATIIGSGQAASPDLAAFVNGVMIRYLDYNDGYTSRVSGHPSDNLCAVLSSAEAAGADGGRVIAATVLAYEMYCRFSDIVDITPFDHSTLDGIASSVASAYLFDLPPDRMADALNLAITPNLALHQPRIDVLSHWKACAAANACRNAVFATLLAARGLTGPRLALEGAEGYFNSVGKGQTGLAPFGAPGRPFKIMECSIKRFPLGQYSQTVVQAALEVREQLPDVRDIAEVHIRTLQKAITIMAGDPQKWRPTTRETADHSMVYTTGVALMHGTVHQRHFGDEYRNDPGLLDLVSRIKVSVSEEANRRAPEAMLCDVTVTTRSGQRYSAEVAYHKGHYKNPLTDAEVETKFRSLAQDLLSPSQTDSLLDRLWHLEEVKDIGEILRLTVI